MLGVVPPPVTGLDPHTYKDTGGLVTGGIAGEFLTRATQSLSLLPELALSWKPNGDASVWTFKLRPNVKFQSGQAFGADDVVATYDRLTAPTPARRRSRHSRACSRKGGTKAIDNLTVEFHLDAPTANFPYLDELDHVPGDPAAGELQARHVRRRRRRRRARSS